MTSDANKGITAITYNYLDLPLRVTFSATKYIDYVYDAQGTKLKKTVTNGSLVVVDQYVDGFIYEQAATGAANNLQYFSTEKGYVTKNATTGLFSYIYQYTDHLGNVRLSYGGAETALYNNTFDSSNEGFDVKGGATAVVQGGALVVTATGIYQGALKRISSNAQPGQRFKFSFTVDGATTPNLRIFISETNPSTGSWVEYY